MPKTFYITTAIDYTNAAPHIGHAYEKVLADVLARFHRLKGDEDVFFLTGVDQHGQKVQQSAEKQGVAPQEFVDEITAKFRALWAKLDVKYDAWAATTDPLHRECVRGILRRLWEDKDPATGESRWLYKAKQSGYYSVRQEQFLTDKERNESGEFGPEWGQVEFREEENFYFRLLDHKAWLIDLIRKRSETGRPLVIPEFRVPELLNAVEKLAGDLCISRPQARLQWGIPFPEEFGAGFVTYVWFDALVNYISFAGYDPHSTAGTPSRQGGEESSAPAVPAARRFDELWPAMHVIGKDILIPAHGVYWPIMLRALDFADEDIPQLLVHGWWNIGGAKMSKSLGNIVDPDALADKYGAEALRYYLMSDITTGKDADFSEERLIQRYNTDLANNVGNLLNRTLSMAAKFRAGALRRVTRDGNDLKMLTPQSGSVLEEFARAMESHQCAAALSKVSDFAGAANVSIQECAPWELSRKEKNGDSAAAERLDAVLYTLAESLRIIAILISPVLPKAAHGIFDQLQWKLDEAGRESRFKLSDATWGGLPDGHVVGKPTPLFPRIETAS